MTQTEMTVTLTMPGATGYEAARALMRHADFLRADKRATDGDARELARMLDKFASVILKEWSND